MSASQSIACVFGNPIEQSKSPIIHKMFAEQFDIDLVYTKRFAEKDAFSESAAAFFSQTNTVGANVTMPFKHDALKWVTTLSAQAKRAGAVNTIIRKKDALNSTYFEGDNTDGVGLVNDLKNHNVDLSSANILMVGAGGAAKGVLPALLEERVKNIVIYNRTEEKAQSLVKETNTFQDKVAKVYSPAMIDFDIVINATSLSLYGKLPDISDQVFLNRPAVYDMVYKPSPTVFMQKAQSLGCRNNIDGLGMLVNQAAQSFYLWFGHYPDVHQVHEGLKNNVF